MGLIDFHAHLIPGIDDGASDIVEAISILNSQKEQGIETVVATPHYDHECSIKTFVRQRDKALSELQSHLPEEAPRIIPAAEVSLFCGLSEERDLRKLCIGDTDYILIEMPYFYWNNWDYDEIYNIKSRHGITPIIAHLDRYAQKRQDMKKFDRLLENDIVIQLNSTSFLSYFSFRIIKALWKLNRPVVLGSDVHKIETRPCTLEQACVKLKKKYGTNALENVMYNAESILNNKPLQELIHM